MSIALSDRAAADVVAAMGVMPETVWLHGDDACDCTFQRIGLWKNPYLGTTLEVRMCCIWEELYKLFPQHVRKTPGYLTEENEWLPGAREWDGEADMPRALWYRQIARRTGKPIADVRSEYGHLTPPQGIPRDPAEPGITEAEALWAVVNHLTERIIELEAARAD